MLFSAPTFLSTLALLLPLTSALPTTRQVQYPPYKTSKHFQLVANVTSGNLPIKNFVLESYHTGAGTAYAVLAANDSTANPRIFYVNGTASEVRFGLSSTVSDAGSGPYSFPEALEINPSDPATSATNYSSVYINAGQGQKYVGLTSFPAPIIQLHGYQGETFYRAITRNCHMGPPSSCTTEDTRRRLQKDAPMWLCCRSAARENPVR